jgi:hypothetical protein
MQPVGIVCRTQNPPLEKQQPRRPWDKAIRQYLPVKRVLPASAALTSSLGGRGGLGASDRSIFGFQPSTWLPSSIVTSSKAGHATGSTSQ